MEPYKCLYGVVLQIFNTYTSYNVVIHSRALINFNYFMTEPVDRDKPMVLYSYTYMASVCVK